MLLGNFVFSQNNRTFLKIQSNPLKFQFNVLGDSLQHQYTLVKFKNHYISKGYLSFNYDSIIKTKDTFHVFPYFGTVFSAQSVQISSKNNRLYRNNVNLKTGFDTSTMYNFSQSILTQLENNGFPFAEIQVEMQFDTNHLYKYQLAIDEGPKFVYDTMVLEGDASVNKRFLEAYLGIKKGNNYNEDAFRKVNTKLNQLPFLSTNKTPLIAFIEGGKAQPFLNLKKKKSDQINGIVGMAPNSNIKNASRIIFTGEVLLKLNNLFRSAKSLEINWRSFNQRSQELKTGLNLPYLFNLPLGLDYKLHLLKFDTLYTSTSNRFAFQYYTSGINGIKGFYSNSTTNLNFVDTNSIKINRQFPAINAIQIKQYGVEANFNLLDYVFNPQKGWFIDGFLSVGSKTILKDNTIGSLIFENGKTLYDSVSLRTSQFQYKIKLEKYFKTSLKTTLKIGLMSNQIIADKIYFNELFREGGINSLKGFDEQSIFASNFNMLELEYRFLFSKDSHFKLFWNGAYFEDKNTGRQQMVTGLPWGLGIGGNIETGSGVLTLMYALGKQQNNSFDFRTGKIHFGINSYF